jgi:hypothetical protein
LSRSPRRNTPEFLNDRLKVLRYVESTKSRFRNEKELCSKLAHVFKIEYAYVWQIWANLKKQYPKLAARTFSRTEDGMVERQERDRFGFRKSSNRDRDIMIFEPKTRVVNIPRFANPKSLPKREMLDLKEIKPVDGVESTWREGKIRPADQKNYRGSFQDKD